MQFIFDEPCTLSAQERYTVIDWFLNRAESVTVTFRKADGSIRVMPCTINDRLLPVRNQTSGSTTTNPSYDSMLVWSLDKNEWRSFKTLNVISVAAN